METAMDDLCEKVESIIFLMGTRNASPPKHVH